jgi:lipopolysaccharide transport system permease protein
MFASPIAYPLSAVPARFKALYLLNPFAGLIEGYRDVLLRGVPPDPRVMAYTAAVCLVGFAVGYAFFKRTELLFADVI